MILNFLKPNWKKIILFIIFILIFPQMIGGNIVLLGSIRLVEYLFESQPPQLNLIFLLVILIVSYLLACLIPEFYDRKVRKFIAFEEEIDVEPPEKK
jgi:hypothetical protein